MTGSDVARIVIVGDAPVGSMTAAALAVSLRGSNVAIALVCRPGTANEQGAFLCRGGDQSLHSLLGFNEDSLLADTGAGFSFGAAYRGFRQDAPDCLVPLGEHGTTLRLVDFHHYVAKLRSEGDTTPFNAYSHAAAAVAGGRFEPASERAKQIDEFDLVFDNTRYTRVMLEHARRLGVTTLEADVAAVASDADGYIDAIIIDSGDRIAGDFFIDCSVARSIRGAMGDADQVTDWAGCLPGSAISTRIIEGPQSPALCVDIEAQDSGWIQALALPDARIETFVCDDPPVTAADADFTRLESGTLALHWYRNCVAIGPAATVVPPLEVSPMHLAQDGLRQLLGLLPRKRASAALASEYNRIAGERARGVRDYLALRFALADRTSGPFWARAAALDMPETLRTRVDLFRCHGRFTTGDQECFSKSNWVSSFINFEAWPASYDPLADMIDEQRMRADLDRLRTLVRKTAAT